MKKNLFETAVFIQKPHFTARFCHLAISMFDAGYSLLDAYYRSITVAAEVFITDIQQYHAKIGV